MGVRGVVQGGVVGKVVVGRGVSKRKMSVFDAIKYKCSVQNQIILVHFSGVMK